MVLKWKPVEAFEPLYVLADLDFSNLYGRYKDLEIAKQQRRIYREVFPERRIVLFRRTAYGIYEALIKDLEVVLPLTEEKEKIKNA